MHHLLAYLRQLSTAKTVLWCYLLWYLVMASFHFDPTPRIWITSLGISAIIGFALILSVSGNGRRDFWTTARLFMMPFCVSSFSALIKDRGFVLIASPVWYEDLVAAGACAAFLLLCYVLRQLPVSMPAQQRIAE
ncbi:MAG: hypothetical protein QM808_18110 [Steroidobacteraceae bacterium]